MVLLYSKPAHYFNAVWTQHTGMVVIFIIIDETRKGCFYLLNSDGSSINDVHHLLMVKGKVFQPSIPRRSRSEWIVGADLLTELSVVSMILHSTSCMLEEII